MEKELELYHRHIALYGDPAVNNPNTVISSASDDTLEPKKVAEIDSTNDELSESEDDYDDDMSLSDMSYKDESSTELDSCSEET